MKDQTILCHIMHCNQNGDRPYWFMQSLNVDYFAEGLTKIEVLRNFSLGWNATVDAHIKERGNADLFLSSVAPSRCWNPDYYKPEVPEYILLQTKGERL